MDISYYEQSVGRTEVCILTRQHCRSFGRDQTTSNFFLCDASFFPFRFGWRFVKRPVMHIYTIFTHCAKQPRRRLFVWRTACSRGMRTFKEMETVVISRFNTTFRARGPLESCIKHLNIRCNRDNLYALRKSWQVLAAHDPVQLCFADVL